MGPNPTLSGNHRTLDLRRKRNAETEWSSMLRLFSRPACASRAAAMVGAAVWLLAFAPSARASTYVVPVALDDPCYQELDTLNGLGLLDTYLSEVKPISRVEAARLTLEAEKNLEASERSNALAQSVLRALRAELREEVSWLENNSEDDQPTMLHPIERLEAQYIFSRGDRRRMVNNGG